MDSGTKDRGMRGRLPTFAAVVIYGLISSFSSADVCRRLSAEPSHGENRGSSPLGSANDFNDLAMASFALAIFGEFLGNKRRRTAANNAAALRPRKPPQRPLNPRSRR